MFGFDIRRATPGGRAGAVPAGRGWAPLVIHEPYTGAWQRNDGETIGSPIANPVVFSCIDLIAREIGKMRLRLMARGADGVWRETENTAYSPLLRRPNRFQSFQKYVESYLASKLAHGNAYVIKERVGGVVRGLYVLDPAGVEPLIAPDGAVYYALKPNALAGVVPTDSDGRIVVPASEMINDPMVTLFHPLIGVSPLFACASAALHGIAIGENQTAFFRNGARPSGLLVAPGPISQEQADKLKAFWNTEFSGDNAGRVAILSNGVSYTALSVNAVDTMLVEQLKLSAEMICACFHVPLYLVNQGAAPAQLSAESLVQLFYSQCLQSLVTAFEISHDFGLGLDGDLGVEFDIDDLIWMDSDSKTKAAKESIGAGALSPDEARYKYFGLGRVPGGDSPYMQQQYYSLAALAARDSGQPFGAPATPPPAVVEPKTAALDPARFVVALRKAMAA